MESGQTCGQTKGNEETRAALRQVVGEDEWDQQQAAYEEWKASYE